MTLVTWLSPIVTYEWIQVVRTAIEWLNFQNNLIALIFHVCFLSTGVKYVCVRRNRWCNQLHSCARVARRRVSCCNVRIFCQIDHLFLAFINLVQCQKTVFDYLFNPIVKLVKHSRKHWRIKLFRYTIHESIAIMHATRYFLRSNQQIYMQIPHFHSKTNIRKSLQKMKHTIAIGKLTQEYTTLAYVGHWNVQKWRRHEISNI